MRILRCADTGLLVELDSLAAVHGLAWRLREQQLKGVLGIVPAARTLLLHLEPTVADVARLEHIVRTTSTRPPQQEDQPLVHVPVSYNGRDLADVAAMTRLREREVVAEHTGTDWTVSFGGFAPGFGYLSGGSRKLQVPRRQEARTTVPAGAVALAGGYSGVYPRSSPGGWQLIGHTDREVWRTDRDPPALLRPGVRVRFEVVD